MLETLAQEAVAESLALPVTTVQALALREREGVPQAL